MLKISQILFNQTIEESNFSSDMQIPHMHFVFRITYNQWCKYQMWIILYESYSINGYSNRYDGNNHRAKCTAKKILSGTYVNYIFFFIIIIMQRRTVIFECKNYGNELRDAVLDAALDAARLAWQHSHSCSSEFKRVFVFTTSQPVISFISSSLSINSESFCCFNYLSSVRWTTSMLATDLGVNIRWPIFNITAHQDQCSPFETFWCY